MDAKIDDEVGAVWENEVTSDKSDVSNRHALLASPCPQSIPMHARSTCQHPRTYANHS
jgi:hypothetical protein